jgi:ubiquitin-associated SH3 domain-containing protein
MGIDFEMKIEPSLFEWTSWFPESIPSWLTIQELQENGFNVDVSYVPLIKISDLKQNETLEFYYERSFKLVKKILSQSRSSKRLYYTLGLYFRIYFSFIHF